MKASGTIRSALLFPSLAVLVFRVIVPTLVDTAGAALVLVFIPSLLLFGVVHLLVRLSPPLVAKGSSESSPPLAGGSSSAPSPPLLGGAPSNPPPLGGGARGGGRGRWTCLIAGIVLALLLFAVTHHDPRSLLLVIPGLLSIVLFRRRMLSWIIVGAALVAIVFSGSAGTARRDAPRLLIVGFDAMTPSIVDSLVRIGELPQLQRLIEDGAWGKLRSEEPLISPVLWTIIASGSDRDETGVSSFYNLSTQVRVPRLWDMFEEQGWTVGVFRWLVTWPPRAIDGFMVPDLLARDNRSFPRGYGDINNVRDIAKSGEWSIDFETTALAWDLCRDGVRGSTLLRLLRHALDQNVSLKDGKMLYRFARLAELEISADIFLRLVHMYSPSFAAFYDNGIDMMSHRMWKYHEQAGFDVTSEEKLRYGDHVCDMYRYSDRVLGRILAEMPADLDVAIVSDHGTEKASSQNEVFFAVNTENLLRDLGLEGRLFTHTLNNNQFVYPMGETDRDSFPGFLEERLARLVFENGKRLFRLAQSEVGDYYIVNDHLAGERSRLRLEGRPIELSRYVEESFTLSGAHSLYGTAIFRGANVKRGEVISGARIHDIAPTVLHWAGLPVGRDMEGKVLRDIFEGDREVAFVPHYRYPNAIDSSAPVLDDATKERLEAMGYVQ